MKPDDVLDMSLDMFNACIEGYSDHIFDLQIVGVIQGYYAGYYGNSKKPKSVKSVIKRLLEARKSRNSKSSRVKKPEVDVESFLTMEEHFKARYDALNS